MAASRGQPWRPWLGAVPIDGGRGVRFRVPAPEARTVAVVLESPDEAPAGTASRLPAGPVPLDREAGGTWAVVVDEARAGDRYRFLLDGLSLPDPISRFQPEGVHGSSEVVAPAAFRWTDAAWRGVPLNRAVVYELHVGTFTPDGTFAAAAARLPHLRDLGVTVVELMPLADFPGTRNWGYDGAALFAPSRCYGRPDDLRRFVDAAHALGLGVHLDVVFNHLGPDGAYLASFVPGIFTPRHRTPWGRAIDLDGPGATLNRRIFIENLLHWLVEYHVDGFRLDATHDLHDESPEHFLAEAAAAVHGAAGERHALVVAEDDRNLATIVQPRERGGYGLDAVWADDFHHGVRVALAGDSEGYYRDFSGSTSSLARTIDRGWLYGGEHSIHRGAPRGTSSEGIDRGRFVVSIQTHDQVGNRAFGERLHHQVPPEAWRAASVLLLTTPHTPLLFMGQEWATRRPFRFFTDHADALGASVTEGRRREFAHFSAFASEALRAAIPDPQALDTFIGSRLAWDELDDPVHAGVLRLYRDALALRRALVWTSEYDGALALSDDVVAVAYRDRQARTLVVCALRGPAVVPLERWLAGAPAGAGTRGWRTALTTEAPAYVASPQPVVMDWNAETATFGRAGALVLTTSHG